MIVTLHKTDYKIKCPNCGKTIGYDQADIRTPIIKEWGKGKLGCFATDTAFAPLFEAKQSTQGFISCSNCMRYIQLSVLNHGTSNNE